MNRRNRAGTAVLLLGAFGSPASASAQSHATFSDPRSPPIYRSLAVAEREAFDLGQAIFNSSWFAAGTQRAERRDGLGPVFNAPSCDACHNNGARATAPTDEGRLPIGFVMQLALPDAATTPLGDVLNPVAIEEYRDEGSVLLNYRFREVRYPDGSRAALREPRYQLQGPRVAELSAQTVLKPRMASPLFGLGLLDAVPPSVFSPLGDSPARFGWQADTRSVRDQTAKAFSREMGLHTTDYPMDDCGNDAHCAAAPEGGGPEVSEDFLQALTLFQSVLAVPRAEALDAEAEQQGAELFQRSGCAACHAPSLPVEGIQGISAIAAYTDLRRHDLGDELADRRLDGAIIKSRWRTAPLWGIAHLPHAGHLGLLHDGRARSVEEAVIWHAGEAAEARQQFMALPKLQRDRLLDWTLRR